MVTIFTCTAATRQASLLLLRVSGNATVSLRSVSTQAVRSILNERSSLDYQGVDIMVSLYRYFQPEHIPSFCAGNLFENVTAESKAAIDEACRSMICYSIREGSRFLTLSAVRRKPGDYKVFNRFGEPDDYSTDHAIDWFKEREGRELRSLSYIDFGNVVRKFRGRVRIKEVQVTDYYENYNSGNQVRMCTVVIEYGSFNRWSTERL